MYRLARQHTTWNPSHLQCCVSFSTGRALLPVVLNQLLRRQRPVWLAYGIIRQYSALADGSRSGDREHFLPAGFGGERTANSDSNITYVHHVVKHNKSCTLCLLLISYPNLTYAAITSKQVVQILASDLVIQILDKQYSVGAWRKFCLG
jgi:hypothetical protein